jgi:diaminopropionate ammonia-lyase
MSSIVTANPLADHVDWPTAPDELAAFHHRMPAYAPTLLLDAPGLAERFGVGRIVIKAETRRMGLPSFKILGASWATYCAICDHIGGEPEPWNNINELAANLAHLRPFKLATATDGNHGRAVSFMARLLGFECQIFVPAGMVGARIFAMEQEGATVTVVDGDYDDAVARAAEEASDTCLIVSDTSWPGYETIPAQVVEGYSTIFSEVDAALDASHLARPDLVVVPMGVGAFMAAAVTHYRSGEERPIIVGVEPIDANCVQVSALAGDITHVPGPHRSIMVGLNCGRPSLTAWPRLASGIDWLVAVDDDAAKVAMRDLSDAAVAAGETGAACLAGFEALLADENARAAIGDLTDATVLLVVTEGATDPANFEAIVGRSPESVGRVLTAID